MRRYERHTYSIHEEKDRVEEMKEEGERENIAGRKSQDFFWGDENLFFFIILEISSLGAGGPLIFAPDRRIVY